MTRTDQRAILAAVAQVPTTPFALRALAEADAISFFVHRIDGDALYSTTDAGIAMGFVGGWIAAFKTLDEAQ
jgi:hypothetical protein